jgi:hypothetical protein
MQPVVKSTTIIKTGLEQKFKTHDWSIRVNMSILSMCIVDTWRVWSRITVKERERMYETQKTFYGHLSAGLIDNNYDQVGGQDRQQRGGGHDLDPDLIDPVTGLQRSGDGVFLRKCTGRRTNANHVHQGRCLVCKTKTSYLCACCADVETYTRQSWVCNGETGCMCFATHRMQKQSD